MAILGAMATPIGIANGVLVYAIGVALLGGSSDGLQAAAILTAVVSIISGVLMSVAARREIDADPALEGRGFATFGIRFPVVASGLLVVLFAMVFITQRQYAARSQGLAQLEAQAAERERDIHFLFERLALAKTAADADQLIHPQQRESVVDMPPEDRAVRGKAGRNGLVDYLRENGISILECRIEVLDPMSDGSWVRLTFSGGKDVRGKVASSGGVWYFLADPVELVSLPE